MTNIIMWCTFSFNCTYELSVPGARDLHIVRDGLSIVDSTPRQSKGERKHREHVATAIHCDAH